MRLARAGKYPNRAIREGVISYRAYCHLAWSWSAAKVVPDRDRGRPCRRRFAVKTARGCFEPTRRSVGFAHYVTMEDLRQRADSRPRWHAQEHERPQRATAYC